MRKIIQCSRSVLWLIVFQLPVLYSTGSGKTSDDAIGFRTAIRLSRNTAYRCDTVPATDTFSFYVSNMGLNSNSGTSSSAPKLSIESISTLVNTSSAVSKQVSIGLDANSTFREQFDPGIHNINTGSFGLQSRKKTARITGMDIIRNWNATQGKKDVYEYSVSHSVDLGSPGYHYLFVAEIDTAMEKLYPVSAVKYLPLVSGINQCETTPGSFSIALLTQNPVTIYIHASEGVPGSNRFRYEVVKRPFTINGFYYDNCTFENLFLQSSGNGYGMLGAGENTVVKNVTFQGGGTHHAVIKSGLVDHSLFLPGPKGLADEIALVFYKPEGSGSKNKINNAVFLDIKTPLFTHTDGTSNYGLLSIDSVYAFADTINNNIIFSSNNTDSIIISNSYSTGYKNFWVGTPSYLEIKNSVINKISEPAIFLGGKTQNACNAFVSNTLITTNSNDGNQLIPPLFQSSTGFLFSQDSVSLKVSNSIFLGRSTWHNQYHPETIFENSIKNNKLEAYYNIYICDVNKDNYLHVINANNSTGKGTASNLISDYNVYIAVQGTIYWTAYPNSPLGDGNIFSFKEWQLFTGQDQHSIFIDLRNNSASLKAIFTDPENGNWTLAQTPQADSIRKINAGMLTPPLFYPLRPTYEDALDHALPGGLSYLTAIRDLNRQVKLEWKTIKEPNITYFGIESGTDKTAFTQNGRVETSGKYQDNLYSFTLSDTSSVRSYYRLRLVNADSSFSYSAPVFVEPLKKDSILNGLSGSSVSILIHPNPVLTNLMVEHPARDQAEISIYDYMGRMLLTIQVQKRSLSTLLPLENFPAGEYIIKWTSGREKKSLPFMKG